MALVGPRPEVPRFVDLADPQWQRVLEARPGITDPLTLKLRDEEKLMPDGETDPERFYLQTLQPFKLRGYLEYLSVARGGATSRCCSPRSPRWCDRLRRPIATRSCAAARL